MMNILGIFGVLSTVLLTIWASLKYLILGSYRMDNDISKRLFDRIKSSASKEWIITGDHVVEPKYPETYESLVWMGGIGFYFSRTERLLTAGWKGKEEQSQITFPRWWRSKVDSLLKGEGKADNTVPVMALLPSGSDRLGELKCDPDPQIFLSPEIYQDIEDDVVRVINGIKDKTGCLLYGSPGNGKTQFVKYLSRKYSLPIYVVYLNPEYSNHDVAMMFASIPRRSIVLMEDFDNYFDCRECSIKNESVRFTFDAFINALDGVHNDYRQMIFVMTANDIDKIDDSIKTRPSRLKFVREVTPPGEEIRMRILGDTELVKKSEGYSLDQVFAMKNN